MKLSEIKNQLKKLNKITFRLPNGEFVPKHFHVTEIGKVTRHFIDCGGTERVENFVNFQLWSADDYQHRLTSEKLLKIIDIAENTLNLEDLEVEVEYQNDTIGKFGLDFDGTNFLLTTKQTNCLDKDKCGIPEEKQKVNLSDISTEESCTPESGCCQSSTVENNKMPLFKKVENFISFLNTSNIDNKRKAILQPLIDFIQKKIDAKEKVRINFICTHNSRRSHLSQIWAQTIANALNIKDIYCYSGGTENTALSPIISDILKDSGFEIDKISESNNPIYNIKFSENETPIIGFSKEISNNFNPKSNFVAVINCSEANRNCPTIPGAEECIPILYEDPKLYDNTPQQLEEYKKINAQIATELKYVFSQLYYY